MSEKITLQDVTDKLSEKLGVTKKVSDDFLREFFSLIEISLEKDGIAKIKGLGVFKVKKVDERKSVNVQTGAEIIIPAHYKVSFMPDKTLSADINKPYAHLETYILDEEEGPVEAPTNLSEEDDDESILDLEEDEKVSGSKIELEKTSVSSKNEASDVETVTESEVADSQNKIEVVESQIRKTEENKIQSLNEEPQANEKASLKEEVVNQESQMQNFPKTENVEEMAANIVEATDMASENNNLQHSENLQTEEGVSDAPSVDQEVGLQSKGKADDDSDKSNVENIKEKKIEDKSEKEESIGDSKGLRWVIIILIIALLGLLGYHYSDTIRNLIGQQEDVKAMVDTTIVQQNTKIVQEEVTAVDTDGNYDDLSNENYEANKIKDEDPNEGDLQLQTTRSVYNFDKELVDYMKANHPEVQLHITNVAGVVKLARGQRLVDLALKYYGHKYFWVYIYYFNTDVIKDPNSLPSGIEVKIPEVDKSLVDYTNSDVVDLAFEIKTNLIEK